MLAIAAASIFAVAFLLNATSTVTDVVFSFTSLLLAGLASPSTRRASARAGQCPAAGAADNAGSYRSRLRVPERLCGCRRVSGTQGGAGAGRVLDGDTVALVLMVPCARRAGSQGAGRLACGVATAAPGTRRHDPGAGHGNGHAADAADGRVNQDGGDRAAACRQAPSGRGHGTTSSQWTLTDQTAAWPWGPLA
jgi:hypothetical protein